MANPNTDGAVADKNFRSLDEVERYLSGVKRQLDDATQLLQSYEQTFARNLSAHEAAGTSFKISFDSNNKPIKQNQKYVAVKRIKKIHIPRITDLRKNFKVVDELYSLYETLKQMESTVQVNFKTKQGVGKTLEGLKKMQRQAENKISAALKFLANLAKKYAPTEFLDFIQEVVDELIATVNFEKSDTALYVHEAEGGSFQFTYYLRLVNLLDDSGTAVPELFVIFTCALHPTDGKEVDLTYHVTTLSEFQTPGSFEPGVAVDSSKAAAITLGHMLELDNFSSALGTIPMNLDPKKVPKEGFTYAKYIDVINVDNYSIEFLLVKGVDEAMAQKITEQLYVELRALMYHMKAKLRVRRIKELGREKISFTLTSVSGPGQMSVSDLEFLKTKLGVDDAKLRKIVRIING